MKMNWKYVNRLIDIDEHIKKIEKHIDIKLPADFIECVKINNGGKPDPNYCFKYGHNIGGIYNLFSCDVHDDIGMLEVYEYSKEPWSEKIIPFADCGGSNKLCFDYRRSETPTIVYLIPEVAFLEENAGTYDYEKAIFKVANNFTELLESLMTDEEADAIAD